MADERKQKQITVKELIEQLQNLNPEALVETEGCDCWGPCSGAETITGYVHVNSNNTPRVLICRSQ